MFDPLSQRHKILLLPEGYVVVFICGFSNRPMLLIFERYLEVIFILINALVFDLKIFYTDQSLDF